MTKQEIRSLIKNLVPKYAQGAEYHDEVVDRAIEKVVSQLYTETFLRDPHSLQRYVKRYGGGGTTIAVALDGNAGIYYSNYPTGVNPIPIPDKASGVRRISTKVQGGVTFYPMDQREMDFIYNTVYTSSVNDKIGYVPTQDRVEYYAMTAAIAALGVRMDLLVPFSDYADTDQVLIPEMPDNEGKSFTDKVLEILGVIKPIETVDDNLTTPTEAKQ
jgi:hypothetical protein